MADTTAPTTLPRKRRLSIDGKRQGGQWRIRVTDTGDGLSLVELIDDRGNVGHTMTDAIVKERDRKNATVTGPDGTVWALGCTCQG